MGYSRCNIYVLWETWINDIESVILLLVRRSKWVFYWENITVNTVQTLYYRVQCTQYMLSIYTTARLVVLVESPSTRDECWKRTFQNYSWTKSHTLLFNSIYFLLTQFNKKNVLLKTKNVLDFSKKKRWIF